MKTKKRVVLFFGLFSFLTITFCLGLCYAMVRTPKYYAPKSPFDTRQNSHNLKNLSSSSPIEDKLLRYPAGKLLFWNKGTKVHRLPFTFFQYVTNNKPEYVIDWYQKHWQQNQIFFYKRKSEKSLNIEGIQGDRRLFLSVNVSWDSKNYQSNIIASFIEVPKRDDLKRRIREKKYQNNTKKSFDTQGTTPTGGTWKRSVYVLDQGIKKSVDTLKKELEQKGFILKKEKAFLDKSLLHFYHEIFKANLSVYLFEKEPFKTSVQEFYLEDEKSVKLEELKAYEK